MTACTPRGVAIVFCSLLAMLIYFTTITRNKPVSACTAYDDIWEIE